jgi:hypothetical protein
MVDRVARVIHLVGRVATTTVDQAPLAELARDERDLQAAQVEKAIVAQETAMGALDPVIVQIIEVATITAAGEAQRMAATTIEIIIPTAMTMQAKIEAQTTDARQGAGSLSGMFMK